MSGSSGGGYGGGFGDGAACEDLVIDTQVSSPRAALVGQLKVDDRLDVVLEQHGGVTVVVLNQKGQTVGGIAAPEAKRLRECIEAGTSYVAKVTRIQGAHINVRIAAAP
jgi:hypothetical protein